MKNFTINNNCITDDEFWSCFDTDNLMLDVINQESILEKEMQSIKNLIPILDDQWIESFCEKLLSKDQVEH